MQEAFIHAKSKMAETQLAEENKQKFLTFIGNTRESVTKLLSHVKPLDYNNYGSTLPLDIEGFFINNIYPARDLCIPKMEDYSMDVFIGRRKVGELGAWIEAHSRYVPHMVVDVAIQHIPSRRTVTNDVFVIHRDSLEMWDRVHADYPVSLPPILSQNTQLITDVLEYAAKLQKPSRGRK